MHIRTRGGVGHERLLRVWPNSRDEEHFRPAPRSPWGKGSALTITTTTLRFMMRFFTLGRAISRLWLLILLIGSMPALYATHITGAEIVYTCLNPATQTYEVRITVYRDCFNGQADFDNNIRLFIFRSINGSLFNTVNIPLNQSAIQPVTVDWTACTGSPQNLCVEYVDYVTTVTLPPQVGGYDLGWARCCRNNVVDNIFPNQGITVTAHVPGFNQASGCNSMPTFNNLPPVFLCVNEPFTFDHSATDIDGDSLVYSISNPYTGINTNNQGATQFNPVVNLGGFFANPMGPPPYQNINFLPGFNFGDPFGGGTFNMNPQSGLLTLTPTQIGLSVFAVSVREYRDGVLLSENKRDFQINVIACSPQGDEPLINSNAPPLANTNGDTVFVMPLESFCYNITLSDPDPADSVILFAASAAFGLGGTAPLPYATLTQSGNNPTVGQVCWQVPCQNEGDTIMLIVGGQDPSDCPGFNIVFDTTYVVVGTYNRPQISHTIVSGGNGASNDTVTIDPLETLCYNLLGTDPDPLDILEIVPVAGPFAGFGGTAPFASLTSTGVNPVNGQVCWTPSCAQAGQTVRIVTAAQDVNYCRRRSFDTLTVIVRALPPVGVAPGGEICLGESFNLQAFGGGTYLWSPATGLSNPTAANPVASPTDTTNYLVVITDTMGCPRPDSVRVVVNPLPVPLVTNDTVRCPGQPVQLQASGGVLYSWSPAATLDNATVANPLASPTVATTYTVTVTDSKGCVDSAEVTVTPMSAQAAPVAAICIGDTATLAASGGATYQWSPALGLSDPASANPFAFPLTTTAYVVTVTDTTGCVDTAQVTLVVNPLPLADAGADAELCIGSSLTLAATGGTVYQWAPGPALTGLTSPNPVASPLNDATYFVTVTDANGCVASDSVRIQVNPLPIVTVSNDTAKCGQTGVPLQAAGGVGFQWLPATGLDDPFSSTPLANPDSSLSYQVAVTDANGCVDTGTVAVRVMYADAGPDVPVCIGDTAQLQAGGGIAYQWEPAAGLLALGVDDPLVFTLDTAAYVVTVTDTTGCTDRDTVRVIVNPLPVTSTFGSDPYVCSGGGTVVNATGGVVYQWTPAAIFNDPTLASPVASPFYSGTTLDSVWTFYVTVIDSNGCVNFDSLDQTVRLLPLISVSNDTTKCPEDSVQLAAAGGVSYLWSPALGLSDPTVATPFANPDSTTTYTATVTAVWGCADSAEVTVNVINPQAGPDVVICAGDTVQLQAAGGVSYSWDNGASLTGANVPDPRAFPLATTDYVVTVTDAFGCVDRDTVRVRVNPLPPASAGPDAALCIGDTLALQASGGVAYLWQGDSLSDPLMAGPLAFPINTSTYLVTVTDSNGCVQVDSMVLTVNPLPLAEAGPTLTKCGEDSIQLAASGGVLYQWTPALTLSDPSLSNPLAAPDSALTYTVTVTDVNGCVNRDSVRVETMYAQATGGDTICFGDTLGLSGSHLGGLATAYAWAPAAAILDPSQADPQVFPVQTTAFVLTVTDSSGCFDTDTVTVVVLPPPPADAGPDAALCIGDTLRLQASGGIGYLWQPGSSLSDATVADPQAFPLATTTYAVVVTDTNGCTALDTVRIQVNPLPLAEAGPDRTQCGEDSIQLAASGGLLYQWAPAAGLSDPQAASPWADPLATTTYTVTVTDSNGCVNTDSLMVSTMYADAGPDLAKCPEDSRTLQAQSLGGSPVRFTWSPALGLDDPAVASPVASPLVTTVYVVEIEDVSGCVDRDTLRLEVFASPPADAGQDTALCIGTSVRLQGQGGQDYRWTPTASLDNPEAAQPLAQPLVTTAYVLAVVDTNGCAATDTVLVTVNALPLVEAGPDQAICRGEAAPLEARGAVSYVWTPAGLVTDPFAADPLALPEVDGSFTVIGTDANGCVNRDSLFITVWQPPLAAADSFQEICIGQEVFLEATGGVSYLWSTGSRQARIRVAPANSTTYWVIPFGPQGCAGDTLLVPVRVERDLPQADFAPDPVEGFYPLPVTFANQSRFATRFRWDFGDGDSSEVRDPEHTYQEPGDYVVTLVADNDIGCPSEKTFSFVRALNFTIFFPNAFSPNGDGHNDAFQVVMRSIAVFQIRIFDRWGQEVYASNDPNFLWDGTKAGQPLPEGVYVFRAEATTFKGERIERGGSITLIR